MNTAGEFGRLRQGAAVAALIIGMAAATAQAAETTAVPAPADMIVVSATKVNEQTPITASLTTTQPQSVINRSVIENVVPATSDFFDVVALTPGASQTTNGNGPGLSESKVNLRGFKDGNYNITIDGVPFGDTNDPTHHSTSYFPNGTYEQIVVDRGPGNAAQLGQANFGGNINIYTRAVADQFGGRLEASYGSWNTQLYRGTLQTGELGKSGIKAVFVGEHKKTDGALTASPMQADNLFGKVEMPAGEGGKLTILASYNNNYFNQADSNGATLDQVARYGKDFALMNVSDPNYATNPYAQTRQDWNFTRKRSDFEIVRLQLPLGERFTLDNKAYTYFYKNWTVSASDITTASATQFASPKINGVITKINGDVPGYIKLNQYRVYGDIVQGKIDTGMGMLTVGAWLEFANTHRFRYDLDMTRSTFSDGTITTQVDNFDQKTTGQIGVNPDGTAITGPLLQLNGQPVPQNIQFDENSSWFQQQYFAQYDWTPAKGLTITPGIKFVDFTRRILSPIATQKARFGTNNEANFRKTLPFLTVNYQLRDNWSVYAQYAKGFLIPALSNLEVSNPSPLIPDPTTTINYQIGTVYSGQRVNVDVDAYLIKLSNTIICTGPASALCTNTGNPSTYKGVEGQISWVPFAHATLLANGSVNESADDVTGFRVPGAPTFTALVGALYNAGKIKLSFVQKFTGKQYAGAGQTLPIDAYSTGILSAEGGIGPVALRFVVYNLFNNRSITNISGGTQYFFNPSRSVQLTGVVRF
ncbi:MAG: TonB-dependent receptor [Sphingomonadales bacterium]|jgi:iron complex outermembrane receptor protein